MDEIRIGSHVLQPNRQLLAEGERVALGPRALAILSVLAEAEGEIVTKDELLEAVWHDIVVEENALQVHVTAIRKALGADAELLETIRGVGYQLHRSGTVLGKSRPNGGAAAETPPAVEPDVAGASATSIKRPRAFIGGLSARAMGVAVLGVIVVAALAGWLIFLRPAAAVTQPIPLVVRALSVADPADPAEVQLAKGITDEMIVRLRREPALRIASATAQGEVPDAFASAFVFDGSVRGNGDAFRVTARLSDRSGEVLWTDTFDSNIGDLFAVQEEIAVAIANVLSVTLDVGVNSTAYGGTDDPEAFSAFVRGRYLRYAADREQPTAQIERAVELDPDYIRAYEELTYIYGVSLYFERDASEQARLLRRMDEVSRRALGANPELYNGNAARAWYLLTLARLDEADRLMQRVAELDEGRDPGLRHNLAVFQSQLGRIEQYQQMIRSEALIDPVVVESSTMVMVALSDGDFDLARAVADRLPPDRVIQMELFWHLALEQSAAQAQAYAREHEMGEPYESVSTLAFDPRRLPDLERPALRRWATRTYGAGGRFDLVSKAMFVAHLGRPERALDYLEIAFERPGVGRYPALWAPVFAEVRALPAFAPFAERVGLVDAWRASGDWGDYCRPVAQRRITCR